MREQTVKDETLGTLTWDDDLEWWTGNQEIMSGNTVSVAVSPNDESSVTVLAQAGRAFERIRKDEAAFRWAAADRLLSLHNEEWNDGPPINSNAFVERMTISEFAAYYDGSVEISYADGDLFSGHTIIVSVDKNGSIQDVSING